MKKDQKHQKQSLQLGRETIRRLGSSQLTDVVGGSIHSVKQSICDILCVR